MAKAANVPEEFVPLMQSLSPARRKMAFDTLFIAIGTDTQDPTGRNGYPTLRMTAHLLSELVTRRRESNDGFNLNLGLSLLGEMASEGSEKFGPRIARAHARFETLQAAEKEGRLNEEIHPIQLEDLRDLGELWQRMK